MGTVGTVALVLTWLAAEPELIRYYPTVAACEKALDEALRDPGARGFCLPLPFQGTKPIRIAR
jgi:hypothetical protein